MIKVLFFFLLFRVEGDVPLFWKTKRMSEVQGTRTEVWAGSILDHRGEEKKKKKDLEVSLYPAQLSNLGKLVKFWDTNLSQE